MNTFLMSLSLSISLTGIVSCRPDSFDDGSESANVSQLSQNSAAGDELFADLAAHKAQVLDKGFATTVLEADSLAELRAQYESSLKAIIDSRCQVCHSSNLGGVNFATFDSVKSNAAQMADAVGSGRMPLGSALPSDEKTSLVNFLNALSALP